MSHFHHGLDPMGSQQDVYVAAAMEAKANLYRETKAQKIALEKKKRKSTNKLPAVQTQASQQSLQRTHSPRASQPTMNMTAQQLAQQQGSLVIQTQLHAHRLRGQYFSVYTGKKWYCDLAGTNIGCAAGHVKGDFQLHDIAYWRSEMDTLGLSNTGVTFCNACVIRDERLSSSQPLANHARTITPNDFPNHMNMNSMGSVSMGSAMGNQSLGNQSAQGGIGNQSFLQRNQGGAASTGSNASGTSTLTPSEFAALQQANENNGSGNGGSDSKRNSRNSKLGSVYKEPGVVKKGWMLKRGNIVKSWKRRYFVLKEDRRLYFYSNDQTSTVKGVAQFFEVEKIIKHDKQIFSVELKGSRTWHFSCANEADRDDWCAKLKILCKAQVMIAKTKNDKGKPVPEEDEKKD